MKLSTFNPNAFLASAAASPTGVMAIDGLECSTQKLCQLFTFSSTASSATEKNKSPKSVIAVDKYESSTQKLCHLFKSAASASEKEQMSDFDDVPLIEGVDHLIAGKTDKEACGLLRLMVLDLMHEVDDYRGRFEEKEKQVVTLEEERSASNQEARDKLYSLMLALEKVTGVHVEMGNIENLPTAEATDLVTFELTKKIENLNAENARLLECVHEMRETMDDLEGENESSLYKIEALEMQFKTINKTRQKVVSRLVEQSKGSSVESRPTAHGRYLETN